MARHYYERYRVSTYVDYYWTKYVPSYTYAQGAEGTPVNRGEYPSGEFYDGDATYSFDPSTGQYDTDGALYVILKEDGSTSYSANGSSLTRYYFDSRAGNFTVWARTRTSHVQSVSPGAEAGGLWSTDYNYRTPNAVNSDGYYWTRGPAYTNYSRGTYVNTIIAEDGTYPDNGRVGTTYWYVKKGRAFPELAAKVDGQVKQGIDGWVKVGGELKRIVQMWTKVGGQLKES